MEQTQAVDVIMALAESINLFVINVNKLFSFAHHSIL